MRCLAVILHCSAVARSDFCARIATRILNEFLRSLQHQMAGGGSTSSSGGAKVGSGGAAATALVHATLGVLLAVARVSPMCARNVYSKINLTSSIYGSLLQRGRALPWSLAAASGEGEEERGGGGGGGDGGGEGLGEKLHTDARFLLLLLLLTALQSADAGQQREFVGPKALLRRGVDGVHKVPNYLSIYLFIYPSTLSLWEDLFCCCRDLCKRGCTKSNQPF